MITDITQLDPNKLYSYADYLKWRLHEQVELIKGKVFRMSPAPTTKHQRISRNLTVSWHQFLDGKKWEVFAAPFDVRFPKKESTEEKEIFDVVQPDICIVCDPGKIDEKGCLGAPDVVIEILSRGNSVKELKMKYELYESHAVAEYWIIHPEEQTVLMYQLVNNCYQPSRLFTKGDVITCSLFPDYRLNLDKILD